MSDIIWEKAVECVGSRIDGALVLLNIDDGMYFTMNDTAADIWDALEEPRSESALVDTLVSRYKTTREQCALSVRRLLEDLSRKGLVKPHNAEPVGP